VDTLTGIPAEPSSAEESPRSSARHHRAWDLVWPAALFVLIAVFVAADLVADHASGIGGAHVLVEVMALAIALVGFAGATRKLQLAVRKAGDLQQDLQRTQADLEHWRTEAQALLERLGTALEHQFQRWGLTPAESEIALLVLKGLSYKEVASARGTTERTVRHQALAIYRKAGFAGRAELAAFFLQDLLLPPRRDGADAGSPPPRA
jgi:DNA-binding CsgD family transcriptional regulator